MATKTLNNSSGFSLMEIIIAVGVLMVISSVGVITIRGFDDRTKEVKAQNAAKEVYNAARAKIEDNDSNTKPQDAANEYNSSQSNSASNKKITVKVLPSNATSSNLYVEAYYGARIRAVYDPQNTQNGNSSSGGNGTPVIPTIKDTVSQLTYQCDTTTKGHLPVFNVSDDTTVSMVGSDGSEKLVEYESPDLKKVRSNYHTVINFVKTTGFNNISEELTMNAGVTYTVKVYGAFTNLSAINVVDSNNPGTDLSFRDCLVSVDKLGKDTGLVTINWLGGKKFTKVTDSIPSTVTNLDCAFAFAGKFNDPNVAKWDVKNVTSLYYTFLHTDVFDQDLNSWDTSNVTNMIGTFYSAKKFNNAGDRLLWDTSNVTTFSTMFAYASLFNQNVSEYVDPATGKKYWDTFKVTNMSSMFKRATSFNNGGPAGSSSAPPLLWKTDSARYMSSMFEEATSFNAPIYRQGVYWNTSKVSEFVSMFKNAKSFNRGIGNWLTTSATKMSSMFEGATKFNQGLSSWNVSKVTAANRVNFNTGALMANNTEYQPKWA